MAKRKILNTQSSDVLLLPVPVNDVSLLLDIVEDLIESYEDENSCDCDNCERDISVLKSVQFAILNAKNIGA